ncbi:hypothetical protein, conserved [Eimeria brunetti]|uniref:Uncharacterized protein n=1 Tax=Eimeria brunetti TaxID=51314 RepID=U6LRW6_9EIME|nr:hypothetical protein, conserved [Eimeria brunetti]
MDLSRHEETTDTGFSAKLRDMLGTTRSRSHMAAAKTEMLPLQPKRGAAAAAAAAATQPKKLLIAAGVFVLMMLTSVWRVKSGRMQGRSSSSSSSDFLAADAAAAGPVEEQFKDLQIQMKEMKAAVPNATKLAEAIRSREAIDCLMRLGTSLMGASQLRRQIADATAAAAAEGDPAAAAAAAAAAGDTPKLVKEFGGNLRTTLEMLAELKNIAINSSSIHAAQLAALPPKFEPSSRLREMFAAAAGEETAAALLLSLQSLSETAESLKWLIEANEGSLQTAAERHIHPSSSSDDMHAIYSNYTQLRRAVAAANEAHEVYVHLNNVSRDFLHSCFIRQSAEERLTLVRLFEMQHLILTLYKGQFADSSSSSSSSSSSNSSKVESLLQQFAGEIETLQDMFKEHDDILTSTFNIHDLEEMSAAAAAAQELRQQMLQQLHHNDKTVAALVAAAGADVLNEEFENIQQVYSSFAAEAASVLEEYSSGINESVALMREEQQQQQQILQQQQQQLKQEEGAADPQQQQQQQEQLQQQQQQQHEYEEQLLQNMQASAAELLQQTQQLTGLSFELENEENIYIMDAKAAAAEEELRKGRKMTDAAELLLLQRAIGLLLQQDVFMIQTAAKRLQVEAFSAAADTPEEQQQEQLQQQQLLLLQQQQLLQNPKLLTLAKTAAANRLELLRMEAEALGEEDEDSEDNA